MRRGKSRGRRCRAWPVLPEGHERDVGVHGRGQLAETPLGGKNTGAEDEDETAAAGDDGGEVMQHAGVTAVEEDAEALRHEPVVEQLAEVLRVLLMPSAAIWDGDRREQEKGVGGGGSAG